MGLGDELAFRQLYDLTARRVAQVVARTLRSPDQTADVVQEVFLQVWQDAGRFDRARGSVLGWLTTMAHRRAVDRVRLVIRRAERDHRAAVVEPTTVPDVAEVGLARVEATALRVAVALLPPRQREAVVLTFFDGYSHQQAALALSVPLGTLKSRVQCAVATLRRQYAASAAPV